MGKLLLHESLVYRDLRDSNITEQRVRAVFRTLTSNPLPPDEVLRDYLKDRGFSPKGFSQNFITKNEIEKGNIFKELAGENFYNKYCKKFEKQEEHPGEWLNFQIDNSFHLNYSDFLCASDYGEVTAPIHLILYYWAYEILNETNSFKNACTLAKTKTLLKNSL